MKTEKLQDKDLLSLVEWIAGGAEEDPKKQTNADRLLLEIYRAVHSHREEACCHEVHKDWRNEAVKCFEDNSKYF